MRVEILKDSFKTIKTAVYYYSTNNSFKFIPENKKLTTDDLNNHHGHCMINYMGNSKLISDLDFAQYGFSYLVDKYKYNNNFLVNQLDNKSKEIIGKDDVDVISSIEDRLFPSVNVYEEIPSYEFFGSSSIKSGKYFVFNLLPEVYKVELYEETLETNHGNPDLESKFYEYNSLLVSETTIDSIKPAIILTFGPDKNLAINPENWYYDGETHDINISDLIDYQKTYEEFHYNKAVSLLIPESSVDSNPVINLSMEFWDLDNINPNRNTNETLLRNDEFYGMINYIDPVKKRPGFGDFRFDINSMTVVSNRDTNNNILFNLKKFKVDSDWNGFVRYKQGDTVMFDNSKWVSLINNNLGNIPTLSSSWEDYSHISIETLKVVRLFIDESKYINVGKIRPVDYIIVDNIEGDNVKVSILTNPGYDIKDEVTTVPVGLLELGEHYHHFTTQDYDELFIFNSDGIEKLKSCKYISFGVQPKQYSLTFDTSNIDLEIMVNGIAIEDNNTVVKTGEKITINATDNNNIYKLDSIIINDTNYYPDDSGNVGPIYINPTKNNDITGSILSTVRLVRNTYILSVSSSSDLIFNYRTQSIKSGDQGVIKFYLDETIQRSIRFIGIEIVSNHRLFEFSPSISEKILEEDGDWGKIMVSRDENIYTLSFEKILENTEIKGTIVYYDN